MRLSQSVQLAVLGVASLATSSTRCALASQSAPTLAAKSKKKAAPSARDFYARAGKALDYDLKGFDFSPFGNNTQNANSPASWKIREAALSRNKRALILLRRGFAFPYSRRIFTSQWDLADDNGFPFFARMRQMARLLMVESEVFAHRGEYAKSIASGLDAVRLSKDISRGGVVDLLVGGAISSMGKSQISTSAINKLNATEAKNAARRMENLELRNVSYADVMREEKRFGQAMLREIFATNDWRKESPTTKTPQQLLVTYNRVMDGVIINVARPFPQRKTKIENADDELNKTMTGNYTDGVLTTGFIQARDNTTSQMLMTQFALRAFRVERGAFPTTLEQLVPNYLRRVPLDSFSNQPLRYFKKNNEYSLYSVGPDLEDNGGKPLNSSKNRPYVISADVKGDIVAGINTP